MKPTPAQQLMICDGLPAALILSAQERHALWDKNPPRSIPRFIDPKLEQDRQLREQEKKLKTTKRIQALRQSKGLINKTSLAINSATQEDDVPKYTIKPLDNHGHPVMRAVTSINDTAPEDEINEKVLAAIKRGGAKVVNVLLVNTLRQVILAWAIKEGVAAPCDAAPFQPTEQTATEASADPAPAEAATETTEAEMKEEEDMGVKKVKNKGKKAKKVVASKIKKPHKAKVAGEFKKGSKMEIVYNLFTRKSGVTTDEMIKATGWKVVGMAQQAKACGLKIKKEKTDKGTRYYAI